jgi:hypothetical protein
MRASGRSKRFDNFGGVPLVLMPNAKYQHFLPCWKASAIPQLLRKCEQSRGNVGGPEFLGCSRGLSYG